MKQYCLDTSALIEVWRKSPSDLFPDFWETIESYLSQKIFILPQATYQEIERQTDGLSEMVKKHKKNCIQPMNEEILEIQEGLNRKYTVRSGANENDLAIIATAQHLGITLVTEEGWQPYRENPRQDVLPRSYKIPRVCKKENIGFCRLIHVFSAQCC